MNTFGMPGNWDEETDVAIIGSGYAGLSAAIKAAATGVRTIIIEKMPYYGGNSIISGGGINSWDSSLHLRQKLNLGDDSWELHTEDTMKSGKYLSDPELVECMAQNAPQAIDFLSSLGVEFANTLPRLGGHSAHRMHVSGNSKGIDFAAPLKNTAENLGAEIRLNTSVKRIWRQDSESRVSGLELECSGRTYNLKVIKGLIIASGGFGMDKEYRVQFDERLNNDFNCTNHRGATGECIRYAQEIGAALIHMEYIQLHPSANPKSGKLDNAAVAAYSATGYGAINVDKNGKRFVNELLGRDDVSNAQIYGLKDKPSYAILNDRIFEALNVTGDTIDINVRSGRIVKANTIPELAQKLNMPYLEETVKEHNGFLHTGIDTVFNKPISSFMIPLSEGSFYAIAQWPSIHFCMGGIRFNEKAQVLDTSGNAIPGLYAAGECCGGIHGKNRLGGNAIIECIVYGCIAGINASNSY